MKKFLLYSILLLGLGLSSVSVVGMEEQILHSDQAEAEEEKDCTICLQPLFNGDPVVALPCSIFKSNGQLNTDIRHQFHTKCIRGWLKDQVTCPKCRQEVSEEVRADILKETFDITLKRSARIIGEDLQVILFYIVASSFAKKAYGSLLDCIVYKNDNVSLYIEERPYLFGAVCFADLNLYLKISTFLATTLCVKVFDKSIFDACSSGLTYSWSTRINENKIALIYAIAKISLVCYLKIHFYDLFTVVKHNNV